MKPLNKVFSILLIVTVLFTLFGVASFASSPESATSSFEVVFTYTSDSVSKDCISYKPYTDPVTNQSGIELIPDLGVGYAIYDNPDTDIIDGIRINGAETKSLIIVIPAESTTTKYEIAVRTVYKEGASGDLAKILDGTYDYSNLITNPIVLFQIIYWGFMAITGIAGFIIMCRSKNKRVKTSEEIASKVTENTEKLEQYIIETVTKVVKEEILPLAEASVKSGKEAVKAILLSTSKSKEAPAALLDVFKESSDIDITNIVDEVCEELTKLNADNTEKHVKNAETLHNIANNVIQEDVNNATQKPETDKVQKSIF